VLGYATTVFEIWNSFSSEKCYPNLEHYAYRGDHYSRVSGAVKVLLS